MATKKKRGRSPLTVKTKKVRFKEIPKSGSIYEPIFVRMRKLRRGQTMLVVLPDDVDAATYHNRLNAALNRFPVKAPYGNKFSKRTTPQNRVAISCVAA